jgi:hypothetical protein
VIDVASIDARTIGNLTKIEPGQHPIAPDQFKGNVNQTLLRIRATALWFYRLF